MSELEDQLKKAKAARERLRGTTTCVTTVPRDRVAAPRYVATRRPRGPRPARAPVDASSVVTATPTTPEYIVIHEVADKHGITPKRLMFDGDHCSTYARQEAVYRMRTELKISWKVIAGYFKQHHSTMIRAYSVYARENSQ